MGADARVIAIVIAVSGVGMVGASAWTARRPSQPIPDLDGHLDRWSQLHGGHDPRSSAWLLGWLRVGHVVAAPLARRGVLPDVLTLWSAWSAAVVVGLALIGGSWAAAAGLVVVVSGLLDTVDGAVAALTDRATRFGYVLDSVADRLADALHLIAVVVVGGSWLAALSAWSLGFLIEYVRARSANVGGSEVGAVTVGERANRVILCALALIGAGALPSQAEVIASGSLWLLVGLSAVGLIQLIVAVRRDLTP